MSKSGKKTGAVSVQVDSIRYDEFAKVKWQQFLRVYTVILLVVLAVVAYSCFGRGENQMALSGVVVLGVILVALLILFRSGIKGEYSRGGFGKLNVTYTFDRQGWTVSQGQRTQTMTWAQTHKLKKTPGALLIYPNKKSTNLIPLRCIGTGDLEKIVGFYQGKKK